MELSLKGKHILFISAQFFGYQSVIRDAMTSAGAIVDYFDERPANNAFVKAAIRINRNILSSYINRYYENIIKRTQSVPYDYIFFIKCESVSPTHIEALKNIHPKAKFIVYHWDSYANNRNAKVVAPYFDRILSFDKNDSIKYNLQFLPLFYTPEYAQIAKMEVPMKYDMLFIGTVHSDRFHIIKRIEEIIDNRGGKSFTWFYFPSNLLYYKMWFMDKSIRKVSQKIFHYQSIGRKALVDSFASARIIVDIQHPKQTGLTMRCIETLGAKKKLVTTNEHIKNYDFYNPNNILIIDRANPKISEDFLVKPYEDIPIEIYERYSLNGWLSQIFYGLN